VTKFGIKLQIVDSKIGEDGGVSEYAGLTVWETIKQLQCRAEGGDEKLDGFDGQITGFESLLLAQGNIADTALVEASDARKLSDGLNEEFGDFLRKYKDNLKKLKEMIRDAKASSQTHQPGAVGGGSRTNVGLEDLNEEAPLTNAQTTVAKAVDGLEDRIDLKSLFLNQGTPRLLPGSKPE
jgi:hypothetical protein